MVTQNKQPILNYNTSLHATLRKQIEAKIFLEKHKKSPFETNPIIQCDNHLVSLHLF